MSAAVATTPSSKRSPPRCPNRFQGWVQLMSLPSRRPQGRLSNRTIGATVSKQSRQMYQSPRTSATNEPGTAWAVPGSPASESSFDDHAAVGFVCRRVESAERRGVAEGEERRAPGHRGDLARERSGLFSPRVRRFVTAAERPRRRKAFSLGDRRFRIFGQQPFLFHVVLGSRCY